MKTSGIFGEMLKTQSDVNVNTMGETWDMLGLDWRLAIFMETAEMIESMPWKWWKKGEWDIDNIYMEIVDIWHFILSLHIEEGDESRIGLIDSMLYGVSENTEYDKKNVLKNARNFGIDTLKSDATPEDLAIKIVEIAKNIGLDFTGMYNLYKAKAVLNNFRQDNGYKEGTYIKMWDGKEDNVALVGIVKGIDRENIDALDIYSELETEYLRIKENANG